MSEPTNKVLVVIPARGGSIGIPNKNLRKIHGKSLVSWAVVFANKLPNVDSICVSSDSEAILNESRDNGDCILDRRPDLLSGPAISDSNVLNHVLHFVEKEWLNVDGPWKNERPELLKAVKNAIAKYRAFTGK